MVSYLPRITNRTDLFITICTVCQAGTNISFGSWYVSNFRHCIGVGRVTPTSSFEVTISCPTFPKSPELTGILGSTLLLEFWEKIFWKIIWFFKICWRNQNSTQTFFFQNGSHHLRWKRLLKVWVGFRVLDFIEV